MAMPVQAQSLSSKTLPSQPVTFSGALALASDLSAAAFMHGMLVVASDEAGDGGENLIQWLRPGGRDQYHLSHVVNIHQGMEMDIEGMAADGDQLYVIGSHSLARKRLKPELAYEKNRQRLVRIKDDSAWKLLYRLETESDGSVRSHRSISLAPLLARDPLLSRFAMIPGKENGIDIEAIAVKSGELFVGFRGPVLRGGYVPVMRLFFEDAEHYRLSFVNLGGRGIRDMVSISNGFLILAGPVGDEPVSFQLWYWNGEDVVPGYDHTGAGMLRLLRELESPNGGKAEAVTLLQESAEELGVLILHDGIEGGAPARYTIAHP